MTTYHIELLVVIRLRQSNALSWEWNCTKKSARKPAERTGMRGAEEGSFQRRSASRVNSTGGRLCVMMREKSEK